MIIKSDGSIEAMNDPSLEKYRIDIMREITKEIFFELERETTDKIL